MRIISPHGPRTDPNAVTPLNPSSPIERGKSPSSRAPAAATPSLPRTSGAASSVRPLDRGPAMPRRRRPRTGVSRMDAAVSHFDGMGYSSADVKRVVNKLLKDVYGMDGWPLLEDSCYHVVQEALFEMEEQEKQEKLQQQQQEQQNEDDDDGGDEGEEAHLYLQEPQQEEVEEEALQQEAAMKEEPLEEFLPIAMAVPPSEAVLAVEQAEEVEPLLIEPPAPRAALPDPAATGTRRPRRPCYGWISESESDSDYEEYLASQQQRVQVPA